MRGKKAGRVFWGCRGKKEISHEGWEARPLGQLCVHSNKKKTNATFNGSKERKSLPGLR